MPQHSTKIRYTNVAACRQCRGGFVPTYIRCTAGTLQQESSACQDDKHTQGANKPPACQLTTSAACSLGCIASGDRLRLKRHCLMLWTRVTINLPHCSLYLYTWQKQPAHQGCRHQVILFHAVGRIMHWTEDALWLHRHDRANRNRFHVHLWSMCHNDTAEANTEVYELHHTRLCCGSCMSNRAGRAVHAELLHTCKPPVPCRQPACKA